jgi:hypothetical protein
MRGCRCQAPARCNRIGGAAELGAERHRSCHVGPDTIEGFGPAGGGYATGNLAQNRSWNAAYLATSDRHNGCNSRQNKIGAHERASDRKIDRAAAAGNASHQARLCLRNGVSAFRPHRIARRVAVLHDRRANGPSFPFPIAQTARAGGATQRHPLRFMPSSAGEMR